MTIGQLNTRAWISRLLPLALVAVLLLMTYEVWRIQVSHQHRLLARHTEDVCVQAARRLETFVDTQLAAAGVLAQHWSSEGTPHDRNRRFDSLAGLFLAEYPSFHGLAIVDHDANPVDLEVEEDSAIVDYLASNGSQLLAQARDTTDSAVSDPFAISPGKVSFFAAWPLPNQHFIVVEYRVSELIDDCFHGQIRAEFVYTIEDEGATLFQVAAAATDPPGTEDRISSVHSFPVRNRQWRLTVSPRSDTNRDLGSRPDLSVPVFGAVLSLGIGLLVYLLQERVERIRLSEARYRGVFDSAADGVVVLGADSTVVDANKAACQMLNDTQHTPIGTCFGRYLDSSSEGLAKKLVDGLAERGEIRLEAAIARHDGHPLEVDVHASRFVHEGKPAILVILTDATERRTAARRQSLLSQRTLAAQEEERRRVARDLHDDLGQVLTALRLELDYVRRRQPNRDAELETTGQLVARAVESVRTLCKGLRLPIAADLGLESSVRQLVGDFTAHSSCVVELEVILDEQQHAVPFEVSLCVYRVLQEAMTNIGRHADCQKVEISLAEDDAAWRLEVSDDGVGFDPTVLGRSPGLGILGMHERVGLLRGTLDICSAPGAGTTVAARIPFAQPRAGEPS